MSRRFWSGFAAGAVAGLGGVIAANLMGRGRHPHVVRLEKSIQIGKPVEEVFRAWSALETLPGMAHLIQEIRRQGDHSHWVVTVGGRTLEWDATTEQLIPNQAIGWKSVNGPKHSGRISFAPLGEDTLVHVTMNYAPPASFWTRAFVQPFSGELEDHIEQVLRDFKAALEGKGQERMMEGGSEVSKPTPMPINETQSQLATGTYGPVSETSEQTQHTRFGGDVSPVEYTRPPEVRGYAGGTGDEEKK